MGRRKSNGAALRGALAERAILGTFVKLPALESIEIAQGAGFDFVIVDLEHSQVSEGQALRLIRHSSATAFPALARIAANDAGLVNRLLEAGASGIQLS